MDKEFQVRQATERDVPALVTLVNSAYRGDSSRAGWTTEADLLGGIRVDVERLEESIRPDDHVVLIHESDDGIAGCVHLEKTGDACYLGMLTTRPTLQSRGIGRKMIEAAEAWATNHWHVRAMHMTVLEQRPELVAWYERRGYVVTTERKPFPYGDERWGLPARNDLAFLVLRKEIR
jgi:N-acetylglutamate synthase-like GNAT family acetyltransferase